MPFRVATTVLVLDDELRTVVALGHDVETAATAGEDLRLANRREVDPNLCTEQIQAARRVVG